MTADAPRTGTRPGTRRAARGAPAWLVCRVCERPIVLAVAAVSFDGAHRHRFSNPAELAFEIGLFDEAPGCVHEGAPTEHYSWFPGYTWRVAVCGGCRAHLGWGFECVGSPGPGEPPDFHGLILDRLRTGD